MYKSREDDYQRRFDDNEPRNAYGYEHNRTHYQDDVYDEDDFYGQIMRNASKNKPYRDAPRPEYNSYDDYNEPPRRTRLENTDRISRMDDDAYRNAYREPKTPYTAPLDYHKEQPRDVYTQPDYAQPEYTQPIRAYERTSQFTSDPVTPRDDFSKTSRFTQEPSREMPSRRSRLQEESYVPKEPQADYPPIEEPPVNMRRRSRPVETPPASYGGFQEYQEPKRSAPMTLSEEYESKQKKAKPKLAKKKVKKVKETNTVDANAFKIFVKQNLLIFVIALINMAVVTLLTASLLYTRFIKDYIVMPSLTTDMIKMCLLLTPLLAYQVAGLHCGYTMMKEKIKDMKVAFKVLLFPIFFIVFEVIGFVCEIPYLIYSIVKMQDNDL